jgi:hypothetical protein
MKILNEKQIGQKIKRLAIEILENNYEEESLLLAGINNRGMAFAQLLVEQLQAITKVPIELTQIRLNPANPLADPVEIGMPIDSLQGSRPDCGRRRGQYGANYFLCHQAPAANLAAQGGSRRIGRSEAQIFPDQSRLCGPLISNDPFAKYRRSFAPV